MAAVHQKRNRWVEHESGWKLSNVLEKMATAKANEKDSSMLTGFSNIINKIGKAK